MGEDKFQIYVDEKGYKCDLTNIESLEYDFTLDEIISFLKKRGVISGIRFDKLDNLLKGAYKVETRVTIAEAIKPGVGKPGFIEHLIDDSENKPQKDDKDNVDFYETGLIKTINEGSRLVKVIRPTRGESGSNVYGKQILGKYGDPVKTARFMGPGTKLDDSGEFIVAARTGIYKKNVVGVVSIVDELVVKGNLDFSVGNIDTSSAVIIKGDLLAGFTCKTSSSISVNGVIEDAIADSGDSIICKSGIINGKNRVVAKEVIRAKYIYEREVDCKNLFVEGMINNATINALETIEAKKISGGKISVMDKIEVNELGNEQFAQTVVNLGINYKVVGRMESNAVEVSEFRKELKAKKDDISNKEMELKKINRRYETLVEAKSGNIAFQSKMESEISGLKDYIEKEKNSVAVIERRVNHLKKEYALLANKVEAEKPELIVNGVVYPNTSIRIKLSGRFDVKQTMRRVKFIIDENNEVKAVKL